MEERAAGAPREARYLQRRRRPLRPLDRTRRREGSRARALAERGGSPTYEAADLAYLADKLERGFERAIYVLGADHHGVREWYRVAARLLGDDPGKVEVILYQLVHILEGGQTKKMSKRRGDIVLLDELIELIGLDAARWYLVSRGPDQTIELDVDLAGRALAEEPRLLRPVRARPHLEHPRQGRRARGHVPSRPRSCRRRRGASSSGWSSFPSVVPRRPSAARRRPFRPTRSASPTTSTASTTTAA